MRPIVDRVEIEFSGRLKVIRLDVQNDIGKILGQKYGFFATPTFVFLGPGGEVIFKRVGSLEPNEIRQYFSQ